MKQWIRTAAAVLAVLLGCTSCGTKEVVPELLDSAAVSVDTAEVVKGTFYDVEVYDSAVVPAVETASFVSGGVLEEKKAKLGDTVKKGDVLALLDTEELEEQIEDLQNEIAYTEQNNAYTLEQLQLRLQIAQLELKQLTGKSGVNANVAAAMPLARLLTTVLPSQPESSEEQSSKLEIFGRTDLRTGIFRRRIVGTGIVGTRILPAGIVRTGILGARIVRTGDLRTGRPGPQRRQCVARTVQSRAVSGGFKSGKTMAGARLKAVKR